MTTDFPKAGDDKAVSLENSGFEVFPHTYARELKRDFPQIWNAGGNIRGNEAFELWKRAERGVESEAVLDWIREREAWSARHFEDGAQFRDKELTPNRSNVAGIVAQVKWGTVGTLGRARMIEVLDELKERQEERATLEEVQVGDLVTWRTRKGKYQGIVEELLTEGVATFGQETLEVEEVGPVALVSVLIMEGDELVETDRRLGVPVSELTVSGSQESRQLSGRVLVALENKLEEHNEKHGDDSRKRTTLSKLEEVFRRGVGAFKGNPSSVRPNIPNAEAWAFARVNSFLYALANLKFRRGKHDTDLLPEDHPESTKGEQMSENRERVGVDQYTTQEEAQNRAEALGCEGSHSMTVDGDMVFMPCDSHAEYERLTSEGDNEAAPTGYNRSGEPKNFERRALQDVDIQGDGELPKIVGYAAVFDSESRDLGNFTEVIKPGAFNRALSEKQDVRAFVDHDASKILGRTKAGTLELSTDSVGLRVEITPPDTTVGRDTVESVRRGDLDSMSFGFVVRDDNWREVEGRALREIRDLDLHEVSLVSFPAYEETSVAVRRLDRQLNRRDGGAPIELLRLRVELNERVTE
jgi:HK97 family phage prohead protease